MQLQLMGKNESVVVSEQVFAKDFNEGLIHNVVTAYMAGGRQGTKAQKTRCEVSGGGKKPWKQKGSGRARAGSSRSPIWRGGGVTFAAKPRDFSKKVNKKAYRHAICSILSELNRLDRLKVVEKFELESSKTKDFVKKAKELNLEKTLIVINEDNINLMLAARNVPHFEVCTVNEVNPVNLIGYNEVLFTKDALKKIEERLQ